jgi:hypothetical protein
MQRVLNTLASYGLQVQGIQTCRFVLDFGKCAAGQPRGKRLAFRQDDDDPANH